MSRIIHNFADVSSIIAIQQFNIVQTITVNTLYSDNLLLTIRSLSILIFETTVTKTIVKTSDKQ